MIAPEGWPFIVTPACVGVVAVAFGWPIAGWILIAFAAFSVFFFRNPRRLCELGDSGACSPADGKVISIGAAPAALERRGLPIQVSIFMSVFNVHVNCAPISGRLVEYSYNPGSKVAAFKEKASLENEQNLSLWEGPTGRLALKQIAGIIARRIVFDHEPGAAVERGDRIGIIRFGSRVDVFLPADAEVLVELGDRVNGGKTPLARFQTQDSV